jgi:hypothetical protein
MHHYEIQSDITEHTLMMAALLLATVTLLEDAQEHAREIEGTYE